MKLKSIIKTDPNPSKSNRRFLVAASIGLASILMLLSPTPAAAVPTDNTAYVTNFGNNTVSVINTKNNQVISTIAGFNGPLGLAMTPDETKVYVANSGATPGTVSVIDTATNNVVKTITTGNGPTIVAASGDGNNVYVTNQNDGTLSVIATATNTVVATIAIGGAPVGAVVTPDSAHVYVTVFPNKVAVVSAATRTVTASITDPSLSGVVLVAINPDGKTVYVSNEIGNKITVISTATNSVTTTIPVGQIPLGLAVTPDGLHLYVANGADSTVSVISTATNTVTFTILGFDGPEGVTIAADGSSIFVINFVNNSVSQINPATNSIAATTAVGTEPTFTALPTVPAKTVTILASKPIDNKK